MFGTARRSDDIVVGVWFISSGAGVDPTYGQLIWVSFDCESAQVGKLLPSPWFEADL